MTKFNEGARKYAATRGVSLVTTEDLEGINVESDSIQGWEREYQDTENEAEKVQFCLRTIAETRVLDEANQAVNTHPNELEFHNPDIWELYQNPETQYGTKIMLAINRVERQEFPVHAFGSRSKQPLNFMQQGDGFQVPPEVGEIRRDIRKVLDKMEPSKVPELDFDNPGDRFDVFLRAWENIAESALNPKHQGYPGYSNYRRYKKKTGVKQSQEHEFVIEINPDKIDTSLEENILQPEVEFWTDYLDRVDNIDAANHLFETDITKFEPMKSHPVFPFGANEDTPALNIFNTATIIREAAANNQQKIERCLNELRSEPIDKSG